MQDLLLFLCIVFPVIAGVVAYLDKSNQLQRPLVYVTGAVLILSALGLAFITPSIAPSDEGLASLLKSPIRWLDLLLLCVIIGIGITRRHSLILALGAVQFASIIFLEFWLSPSISSTAPAFTIDSLALTLVLVVSIVGSIIAAYSIDYMAEHEEHLKLKTSRRPQFFCLVLVFLGAMNGLVLADDLGWLYFFWEITTICSFFLIGHDQTDEAQKNACTALWMNLVGGVAFAFTLVYAQLKFGTLSIAELTEISAAGGKQMAILLPVVALCFAGFTKSAQLPFQSWLCGAMVAPTPVSALLHSSTMVKAGVYLILRLAPLYAGTYVSSMVAICGAFTFFTAAALAVGQSNGKKVLAYSTISNLGLIIACAGINTQASLAAGMMILIFHAISKALLFLCVGTIEQNIESRDIEDMRGIFDKMPRTALITALAILSMMLPPFGMLLGKWMAIESATEAQIAMPFIVALLALGSGLTVLFWARWAGSLLSSSKLSLDIKKEEQSFNIGNSLKILSLMVLVLSFLAPALYVWLIKPAVSSIAGVTDLLYTSQSGGLGNTYGVFAVYPLYILLMAGFWLAWRETKKFASTAKHSLPYMSGVETEKDGEVGFTGPMMGFVKPTTSNYYLESLFGESRISRTANIIALVLIAMLLGGIAQ